MAINKIITIKEKYKRSFIVSSKAKAKSNNLCCKVIPKIEEIINKNTINLLADILKFMAFNSSNISQRCKKYPTKCKNKF